jgi:hypothetical protein
LDAPDTLKQPGKAMIQSSRRDRRAKALAEVLAMIANAQHPLAPHHRPLPIREADERLSQSATAFCAALDFYAERATRKRKIH